MLRFVLFLIALLYLYPVELLAEHMFPLLRPTSVDSVKVLLQTSKPDTSRVNLWLLLGEDFNNKNNPDSAFVYGKKAEGLSKRLNFSKGLIRSRYIIGSILYLKEPSRDIGKKTLWQTLILSHKLGYKELEANGWVCYSITSSTPKESWACLGKAVQGYQQAGNTMLAANILKRLADSHLSQGELTLAVRELFQVLTLYRSINYQKLHYTYDLLAEVHRKLGNYKEALKYSLATIESAKLTNDTASLSFFYLRTGGVYKDLNQNGDALVYYKKALPYFQDLNQINLIYNTAYLISEVLLKQGKPQEALTTIQNIYKTNPAQDGNARRFQAKALAPIYEGLKNYGLAEKYYEVLLQEEQNRNKNDISTINTYSKTAAFYLKVNKLNDARILLSKGMALNKGAGSLYNKMIFNLLLSRLDSIQGNYRQALVYFQQYKILNDSIFNETKSKQIASLQLQFETKEKEQNISLLTKQNQVQQANLRQKEFQRNAFIGGTILLILSTGLICNRYRLKQKSNQLLEAKQEEIHQKNQTLVQVLLDKEELLEEKEWMMREIHHRVKNNLQIISGLLYSQSAYLQDLTALTAIRDSQNRVHAMALIHQKLYQSNNLDCVPMQTYIQEIVSYLHNSFNRQDSVQVQLEVSAIELEISLAVPLGLIINETVTNALKYAFPDSREGIITLELLPLDSENYLLTVADNGIGLPPDFNLEESRTLGLNLVKGLSRQLKGFLQISHQNGVHISLQFNPVKLIKPHVLFT